MSFYPVNLAIFAVANAILLIYRHNRKQKHPSSDGSGTSADQGRAETQGLLSAPGELKVAARQLQLEYYSAYAFAVAADWLQGPHIYAMYKYEKGLPEKHVAALYASGFISGAVSASFAGGLSDRFGRRMACLVYCAAYIITCVSMLSDNVAVLFLGRLFGGMATTLLFSVFEAWVVTEYHQRNLIRSHLSLGTLFGNAATLSSVVAIVSGVVGDFLVARFNGARVWPFVAAAAAAAMAALLIVAFWPENYGNRNGDDKVVRSGPTTTPESAPSGLRMTLRDKRIWGLGFTSTFFEGTMYLFVFFWSQVLSSARKRAGSDGELPFGLVFSSFMCAMMAGSNIFSMIVRPHIRGLTLSLLLTVVLVVSGCLLAVVVLFEDEKWVFWTLCVIELCIGIYFPSMSYLKSEVVEDGARGRVYSIMRLPLNVFVVVVHSLDQEGDAHRNHVFLTCAVLLITSFLVLRWSFG
ncbi:hypothetical protein ACRALDRAFT_1079890 [Sodiomyces alcalophilus JCM 7366]|uniref:uncharacterized protein n=1 Tax=Sodiomyces alcalophilus JCM 7366 TaxID=591952 RepID=UPI0039B42CDD